MAGVDVVVFDAVARLEHGCVFEAGDGAEEGGLCGGGDGHGDAVGVDGGVVEAFRFEPDKVGGLVGEAEDLGFEGGAVAGAFNGFADVDGFVEVGAEDGVGFGGGGGAVAEELGVDGDAGVEVAEGHGGVVAVLREEGGVVDGAAVDAGGCAGF